MSTPKTTRFIAQHHRSRPRLFGLGWTEHTHETLFAIATLPGLSETEVDHLVNVLNSRLQDREDVSALKQLEQLPPAIRAAITDALPASDEDVREVVPDFGKLYRVPTQEERPDAYTEDLYNGVYTPRTMGMLWHSAIFEADSAAGEVDEEETDLWIFGSLPEITQRYPSWWRQQIVNTLYRMAKDIGSGKLPELKCTADVFAWLEIVEGAKASEGDDRYVEYMPWMLELPQYDNNDFRWDDVLERDGSLDWEDIEEITHEGGAESLSPEDWFAKFTGHYELVTYQP